MPVWKRQQQDYEQLQAMDWYSLVAEALTDVRSCQKSILSKVKINLAQSSQLACAFSSKLSKFWPLSPVLPNIGFEGSDGGYSSTSRRSSLSRRTESVPMISSMVNEEASCEYYPLPDNGKNALKEVYRVLKELEAFFLSCSSSDWWKSALVRGDNGEAISVHIHNLVWSVAALDVAIHHAKDSPLEIIDTVCSRRIGECYAEMSCLHHKLNESADRKHLILMLTELQEQYSRFSKRKKRTLRVDEEHKYRISEFLLKKLQSRAAFSIRPFQELPESLSIDPKDIDFSKRRLIGRGSFGAVYEASWLGMKVAVKELPCGDSHLFKEEASILAMLSSPFIVQLLGWSIDEEANVCHLVMELCSNNLRSHIERRSKHGPPFCMRVAVDIMLQIARGMEYLHSQRIIHRDLRASNILVDDSTVREFLDEGYVRVKLCDFGMAKAKLNSSRFVSSMKGATYWRAPEVFSDPDALGNDDSLKRRYTDKADVYSFAMTCYEILTGQIPFEGILHKQMYQFVVNDGRPELPTSCPTVIADFIKRCWHGDAACRPPFWEVCRMLRHVKLLLMRVDAPENDSLLLVTTEFDYLELSKLLTPANGGESFNGGSFCQENEGDTEREILQMFGTPTCSVRSGRMSTFHRIRSMISFSSKPADTDSFEALILSSLPHFVFRYSLQDLRTATANFSERICSGEAGCVFRGVLSDATVVAVKVIRIEALDNMQLSCLKVAALANAYHANLVRFRGYCLDLASNLLLVSDYMENFSLDKWLNTGESGNFSEESGLVRQDCMLDWETRLKVAIGVARGLTFLHEDCGQCVLPVGLKASKVLLNEKFDAKINSLSLVDEERDRQFFKHKFSFEKSNSIALVVSSEALMAQRLDVYSFGIILFEILVGHPVDLPKMAPKEGLAPLLRDPKDFLRQLNDGFSVSEVNDPFVPGILDIMHLGYVNVEDEKYFDMVKKAKRLLQSALWCVQDSQSRPTMSQVLRVLEGNSTIPENLWVSFNSIL